MGQPSSHRGVRAVQLGGVLFGVASLLQESVTFEGSQLRVQELLPEALARLSIAFLDVVAVGITGALRSSRAPTPVQPGPSGCTSAGVELIVFCI